MSAAPATALEATRYLSPEQVCDLIPGMTKNNLAQLRHKGGGPVFLKPTPKVVVYREADVIAWTEASAKERTDRPVGGHLRAIGGAR